MSFLRYVPPMGIYETLYAFLESYGSYMGEPGTHPWSQGFPLTTQLPNGPALPSSIPIDSADLKYPKAWGLPALREAIASYYQTHYDAKITPENIMIFAGGRPALLAITLFLDPEIKVRIASTEYTPYYDLLEGLGRNYELIPSNEKNCFRPTPSDYVSPASSERSMTILSNPCNPTGVTMVDEELEQLVQNVNSSNAGLLIDEAYEMFHNPPVSALRYVNDIDSSNIFVVGAATKGLQSPGIRVGWAIASKSNIEILSNYSSFGMGGVSHPSQLYALQLFEPSRVMKSREAVPAFYHSQRERYGEAFERVGLELFTGDGGFYHWCKLPGGLSAEALNQRLFKEGAAILKGTDCDMARQGEASTLREFFRFSFGALPAESFENDIEILERALT